MKRLFLLLALTFTFSLTACIQNKETLDSSDSEGSLDVVDADDTENMNNNNTDTIEEKFRVIHELVMTNNPHGYEATFEEWMDVVSPPTDENRALEFTINNDHLKWRYEGENSWNSLVNLLTLLGGVHSIEGYHYDNADLIISFNSENEANLGQLDFFVTVEFLGFNETLLEQQYIKVGTSANSPNIPEVEGYMFSEWNTNFSNVSNDLIVEAIYIESE